MKSLGSGTLVYVSGKHGMVITNWHVVRDAKGPVEVVFPDGFRSRGTVMKLDKAWDLAAIGIWRPLIQPVKLSVKAPQVGEVLTIAGYGSGRYRSATGRCTQYVSPGSQYPSEMIEMSAEARQGDSGGPIFNSKGELAGVLLGANTGHTVGSYCGRVDSFMAEVASILNEQNTSDIKQQLEKDPLVTLPQDNWVSKPVTTKKKLQDPLEAVGSKAKKSTVASIPKENTNNVPKNTTVKPQPFSPTPVTSFERPAVSVAAIAGHQLQAADEPQVIRLSDWLGKTLSEQVKSVLAIFGALALAICCLRLFRLED
ncbi:MAG: serine protease [Planctomycetales bacterium]